MQQLDSGDNTAPEWRFALVSYEEEASKQLEAAFQARHHEPTVISAGRCIHVDFRQFVQRVGGDSNIAADAEGNAPAWLQCIADAKTQTHATNVATACVITLCSTGHLENWHRSQSKNVCFTRSWTT